MRILVTGAFGYIGAPLSRQLAANGHDVVAMYRHEICPGAIELTKVTSVQGDITSPPDVARALAGCDACFHLAALAKPSPKHADEFQAVNVEGTRNVFEAALEANLTRVVFTSSAGVFGPSTEKTPTTETSSLTKTPDTEYERSKIDCESIVSQFQDKGLDIATLYPSRVFGPGPMRESNVLTQIFKKFYEQKWRVIPGNGETVGNYVFIDDVVEGHFRAMFHNDPNQRFLLGGENLSFNKIVEHLHTVTDANHRLIHVPKLVVSSVAKAQASWAWMTGKPPWLPPSFVNKYFRDWHLDCRKSKQKLGLEPTPFREGLQKTIDWIRSEGG